MRNRLLPGLMFLALPACLGASEPPPAGAGRLAGPVTYEVRSWGRLLLRWQVAPDGSGEIWRGTPGKGQGEVRKFRLRLQGDPFRAFVANVDDVQRATRGGLGCKKEVFDLPYGSMTWDYPGARQVYHFDAGCRSDETDKAVEILGAASTIVETMANVDAKPYVTEAAASR